MSTENQNPNENTIDPPRQLEPAILESEIVKALHKLKNHKSAGKDAVVAEMIKISGEIGVNINHSICNKIWKSCKWPIEWTESIYIF
jgi:divalent metal cation (Fe/Co/Zn/Cd) transporter